MGAVPGSGVLSGPSPAPVPMGRPLFDVERFRSVRRRTAVVRRVARATVVLGSTQPARVVDAARAGRAGVDVVRRRSGGGAVLLLPRDPLWVDVWVPREDPLWEDDVVHAAEWVGQWWAGALVAAGAPTLEVHSGGSVPGPWSRLACFAGVGPGEVLSGGRKIVGVAQWRGRQGALFHSCAYRHWDPAPLVEVVEASDAERRAMTAALRSATVGMEELVPTPPGADALLDRLPTGPAWDIHLS